MPARRLYGVRTPTARRGVPAAHVAEEIANARHEILKWMIATMVAQTAPIVAVTGFLQK